MRNSTQLIKDRPELVFPCNLRTSTRTVAPLTTYPNDDVETSHLPIHVLTQQGRQKEPRRRVVEDIGDRRASLTAWPESTMESPGEYLESPMEGDDVAYPCKGCGDVRSIQPEGHFCRVTY